jgi:two-component system chemotaxis sensor kinase CheA
MISLKSKIIFGIVILLGVTVGFSLFYSYNLFITDKKTYIFETALRRSENMADQVDSQFKQMRQTSFSILKLIELSTTELNTIFKNNDSLLFAIKVNNSLDKAEVIKRIDFFQSLEKQQFLNNDDFKIFFINNYIKNKKLYSDHVELINYNNHKYFFVANPIENSNEVLVTFFKTELIYDLLDKDELFKNRFFLLDSKQITELFNDQSFFNVFTHLNKQSGQKGSLESMISGKSYLLAYVKYPMDNFMIISSMPSEKAFEVTQSLIMKTVFFSFAILGFAIVAGILFSLSITRPIEILTKASRKIAKGNFNISTKVESNDELKILSDSFDYMAKKIQNLLNVKELMIKELNIAKLKLEEYNKNLELMVAKRTEELRTTNEFMGAMVNSLDQGLVVFDQDLKCNDIYTEATIGLFGKSPKNLNFIELLDFKTAEEEQMLKKWAQITFTGMLHFDSAVGLAPQFKKWGNHYTDDDFKMLDLHYFPMRNEDDDLKNIVVVATDKTNEIQNRELFKEKEQYVAMILKVLSNKTQFTSFVNEVHSLFAQLLEVCSPKDAGADSKINLKHCMMLFHTLNGGFGLFCIFKLQQLARNNEEKISKVVNAPELYDDFAQMLPTLITDLQTEFNVFLSQLDGAIGTSFGSGERIFEISQMSVIKVKEMIDHLFNDELTEIYYEEFVREPVINYFSTFNDLVQYTSSLLSKKIKPLIYINQNVKIEAEKYREFFNSLVHLFRNCVDHGIEFPHDRESLGKDENGEIKITFEKNAEFFKVTIEDDGGGINPEIIRKRLSTLGDHSDYSQVPDDEIISKIFEPFFSTRDEVTSVSGRGVGMSAIKEIVDRMGGKIIIKSVVGKGSQFIFIFNNVF